MYKEAWKVRLSASHSNSGEHRWVSCDFLPVSSELDSDQWDTKADCSSQKVYQSTSAVISRSVQRHDRKATRNTGRQQWEIHRGPALCLPRPDWAWASVLCDCSHLATERRLVQLFTASSFDQKWIPSGRRGLECQVFAKGILTSINSAYLDSSDWQR